jgi:peptide/nickel transport system substrate-binding protein
VVRHPAPHLGILGFLVTPEGGPFADPAVREAIDLALDREALVRHAVAGQGQPAAHLAPRGVFGAPDERVPRAVDLAAARKALSRSSRPGGFRADLSHGVANAALAEGVGRQLLPIGIELRPVFRPWEELDPALQARRVPAYLFHMTYPTLDAGRLLATSFRTPVPDRGFGLLNFSGFQDAEVDALIERSSRELDPARRLALLRAALSRVEAARAWLPLYVRQSVFLARPGLLWEPRLDGRLDLDSITTE